MFVLSLVFVLVQVMFHTWNFRLNNSAYRFLVVFFFQIYMTGMQPWVLKVNVLFIAIDMEAELESFFLSWVLFLQLRSLSSPSEIADNEDILRIFLMACEVRTVKLSVIGLSCLQKLISHDAVAPSALKEILSTLKTVSL
jgi:hypothetical protein